MSYLDIIMILSVVVFLLFSRTTDDETIFGRDSTATLRGLAMIGIILHHIHNRLGFDSFILSQVGYLGTGLFFFISGYGNMLSMNKKDYIELKWFINKFLKIYIPYFVAYWFYYLGNVFLYSDEVPTLTETIQDIFTISLPNEVSWFPKIIVLCFFLHFIVKKLARNKIMQMGIIGVVLCIYIVVMYKNGVGSFWYNSVLCYPFGVSVALCKDRIMQYVNSTKSRIILLICSIITFGLLFIGSRFFWYTQLLCALSFSIMCFVYTMLFKTKTKVMAWVGNNSFEFYLFHIAALQLFCRLIPINHYLYTIGVFLGTFFVVYVYLVMKKIVKANK